MTGKRGANKVRGIGGSQGFTLIEMAIVLIIIGIIIGAVVKGKDVIRSANQKKIYTKFVNSWRLAYLNFCDRTGMVLGDLTVPKDGEADGPTCTQLVDGDTANNPPNYYGILQVGLNAPTTNGTDFCTWRYTDSTGATHALTLTFKYDSAATGKYNYMEITQIPNELCIALDTMIDGVTDGTSGDFIGNATSGAAWGTPPENETTARLKMEGCD